MDNIKQQISYIEGLIEGLDLYDNKREGKVYDQLVNILYDFSETIEHLNNRVAELEEYVEAIDEDLNDIEWDYYEDDEFDDDIDDYYFDENEDEDDDEDDIFYRVVCPNCNETVMVDSDVFESDEPEEIVCPNCNEVLIIDSDDDLTHSH